MVHSADYPELFHAVIAEPRVRRPEANVRVRIFGTVDARLISADRLVLGGLVEGVWPPESPSDPWLNRPMRHTLGLDLPERRVGLSAHDFAQVLGDTDVILTRAAKVGGTPTVASRFVHRLEAVAGEERWNAAIGPARRYVSFAGGLDRPSDRSRSSSPNRSRHRHAPVRLSVTAIEDCCATLIRSTRSTSSARAARSRRHAVVGRRPWHRRSMMRSANSRRNSPTAPRRHLRRCCAASARNILRR